MGDRDAKARAWTNAWALLVTVGWGTASWPSVQRGLAVIIVIIVIVYVVTIIVIIVIIFIVVIVTDIVVRFRIYWGKMMVMNIVWNRIVARGRNNWATAIIITSNDMA